MATETQNKNLASFGKKMVRENLEETLKTIGQMLPVVKIREDDWDLRGRLRKLNNSYLENTKKAKEDYGVEFLGLENRYKEMNSEINKYLKPASEVKTE